MIAAPGKFSDPWIGGMTGTNTAWSGPWGVSFTANLTPDPETGIWREMTEEQFIQALRTGRHSGQGTADPAADAVAALRPEDRRRPEGDLRLSAASPADQEQGAGSAAAGAVMAASTAITG